MPGEVDRDEDNIGVRVAGLALKGFDVGALASAAISGEQVAGRRPVEDLTEEVFRGYSGVGKDVVFDVALLDVLQGGFVDVNGHAVDV